MTAPVTSHRSSRRLFAFVIATIAIAVILVIAAAVLRSAPSPAADTGSLGDRSLLLGGPARSMTADRITVTDQTQGYRTTVRINHEDIGLELDVTRLDCHGGMLAVVWFVGNLEPTVPDTGLHLSAKLDAVTIGSILKGSTRGIWNDDPTTLRAVADCPPGRHRLAMEIVSVSGTWGIPYVGAPGARPSDELIVNRGFVATEYWQAR